MAYDGAALPADQSELLTKILSAVESIQNNYSHLPAAVEAIQGQVNILAGIKQVNDAAEKRNVPSNGATPIPTLRAVENDDSQTAQADTDSSGPMRRPDADTYHPADSSLPARKPGTTITSRIILTTYPGQSGIDPLIMSWGHSDPLRRGPVVVSRNQTTIRRRNGRLFGLVVCRWFLIILT